MNEYNDHYSILGVYPSSNNDELDLAFKEKIKIYHPDVFEGDKAYAEQETKKIIEAYSILKDPIKKSEYDKIWIERNKSELTVLENSNNNIENNDIEQKKIERSLLFQKRRRQLDNLIMLCSIVAVLLVFSLTVYFKR